MNLKPIGIVFFAFALAAAAVLFIYQKRKSDDWEKYRPAVQEKFLSFPLEAVARLSFRNGDEEVRLFRKEGAWVAEGGAAPADSAKIDSLVRVLWEAKAAELSKATPSQLAELRLVLPGKESWAGGGILVVLQDEGGAALATILFGKKFYSKDDPEEKGAPLGRFVSRLKDAGRQPEEVALLMDPLDAGDDWFKKPEPPAAEVPAEPGESGPGVSPEP